MCEVKQGVDTPGSPLVFFEGRFEDLIGILVATEDEDPHEKDHDDEEPKDIGLAHMGFKLDKIGSTRLSKTNVEPTTPSDSILISVKGFINKLFTMVPPAAFQQMTLAVLYSG